MEEQHLTIYETVSITVFSLGALAQLDRETLQPAFIIIASIGLLAFIIIQITLYRQYHNRLLNKKTILVILISITLILAYHTPS